MDRNANRSTGRSAAALFAAMGATALIAQTALLRQFLVIFHGNELAVGLFFGCWFFGIVIGAELSGRWVDRLRRLTMWETILVVAGALSPPMIMAAMKTMPAWYAMQPGVVPGWSRIMLAGLLASPVGMWVGLAFPFFARVSGGEREVIGRLFVWEAFGSMLAGLAFAFVLAPYAAPLVSALLASLVLLIGWLAWADRRSFRVGTVVAIIAFSLLLMRGNVLEQQLERLRFDALGSGAKFELSLHTRYQNVVFATAGEQTQIYGNGGYLDSFPDPYVHRQEAALLLAQHAHPRRIVLLGGGFTGLAVELLTSPVVQRLDIVHLDKRLGREIVSRLPTNDRAALEDPRLHIHTVDVRRFVRESKSTYDLVVVVAPDPSTALLNRFYTLEFFRGIRRLLDDKGVLALSLTGAANLIGDEVGPYLASVRATLASVFPKILILPGDQMHIFASLAQEALAPDLPSMQNRYAQAFDGTPPLPVEVIDQWVVPERIALLKQVLAGVDAELNRDLRPVSYLAFLRVWDRFAGGGMARWLAGMVNVSKRWWQAGAFLLCIIVWLLPMIGCCETLPGRYGLVGVATSGFVGMAAVVLASIAYQSIYGQMYQKVALVIAAYMGGLAVGGYLATKRATGDLASSLRWLRIGDAALALTGLGFACFLLVAEHLPVSLGQTLLIVLTGVTGAAAGIAFPAAAAVLGGQGMAVGRRAGRVDAVDHFAAFVGALIVGVLLLPTLGILAVCLLWTGLKTASMLVGWACKKQG